jgi:hypothetical protein
VVWQVTSVAGDRAAAVVFIFIADRAGVVFIELAFALFVVGGGSKFPGVVVGHCWYWEAVGMELGCFESAPHEFDRGISLAMQRYERNVLNRPCDGSFSRRSGRIVDDARCLTCDRWIDADQNASNPNMTGIPLAGNDACPTRRDYGDIY